MYDIPPTPGHLAFTDQVKVNGKVNGLQQLATSLTATGTHVPCGSTQCYLPPARCSIPARGVHGNGEDWDPMGMGVRSAMGWEWDGNGN